MKRILITNRVHPLLIKGLRDAGFKVNYEPDISYEEVGQRGKDYDGLIINTKVRCDQTFIEKVLPLDFIGRLGSGLDIIDLPYAARHGVIIISTPEGNARAVGEHALGMILSLRHKICRASYQLKLENRWIREKNRGMEMQGKTLGILGFGHTGSALAGLLSGWDMRVLTYDKYKEDATQDFDYVEQVSLERLVEESDILSVHLPLTDETDQWIDHSFLSSMKEGSFLINTSRGSIVVLQDLLAALKKGHIAGVGLDVLENEKFHTYTPEEQHLLDQLKGFDNCIITPHIAGWTNESLRKIGEIMLQKVLSVYV
jgi:D-3-phosphoglycerate dehydrogenase